MLQATMSKRAQPSTPSSSAGNTSPNAERKRLASAAADQPRTLGAQVAELRGARRALRTKLEQHAKEAAALGRELAADEAAAAAEMPVATLAALQLSGAIRWSTLQRLARAAAASPSTRHSRDVLCAASADQYDTPPSAVHR